jgi:hypothetical protein
MCSGAWKLSLFKVLWSMEVVEGIVVRVYPPLQRHTRGPAGQLMMMPFNCSCRNKN